MQWLEGEEWMLLPDEAAPRPIADEQRDELVIRTTPPGSETVEGGVLQELPRESVRAFAPDEVIERSLTFYEQDDRVRPLRWLTALLMVAHDADAQGELDVHEDALVRFRARVERAVADGLLGEDEADVIRRADEPAVQSLMAKRDAIRRTKPFAPVRTRVEELRPAMRGTEPSPDFVTIVVPVDGRRHACVLATSERSGPMPQPGDTIEINFGEEFGRIQTISLVRGETKSRCWGMDPHPTLDQMRALWAEWGVPFVAEARNAQVVEIEETGDHTIFRFWALERAGIAWAESASVPVRAFPGPDAARRRRLGAPSPDVLIVCRLRADAAAAIRDTERSLGLPRVPMIVSGGRPVEQLVAIAQEMDADAVVRFPADAPALVEAVIRLGWPEAFAHACREMGIDAATRPWPVGTAAAPARAGTPQRLN